MHTILVACNLTDTIGLNGTIPWKCPEDLKFFKETTLNSTVIMGRKTFLSIPEDKRPLKQRRNIVCSRNSAFPEVENCCDLIKLLTTEENSFIIGGQEIYNQSFEYVDQILLSRINDNTVGDCFFKIPDDFLLKETITMNTYNLEIYDKFK